MVLPSISLSRDTGFSYLTVLLPLGLALTGMLQGGSPWHERFRAGIEGKWSGKACPLPMKTCKSYFSSHPIGQDTVTWPQLAERDDAKWSFNSEWWCILVKIEREGDKGYWGTIADVAKMGGGDRETDRNWLSGTASFFLRGDLCWCSLSSDCQTVFSFF